MSRVTDYLNDKSRLAKLIQQVENGEPVDVPRMQTLQALDVARVGELFVADYIERSEQDNADLKRQLTGD
jgi:hypothetical protein